MAERRHAAAPTNIDAALFGQRFSELLNESGKTVRDVADLISLSPSTISRYSNGLLVPKIPTLYALADIFNVNPLWLMGYDKPKYIEKDDNTTQSTEEQELLEYYRNREDMRMLFKLAKGATADDIKTAAAIIEALRKKDE